MDVALRTDLVGREEPRRRGNSHGVSVRSVGERHDAGTQKLCQPAEQQAEDPMGVDSGPLSARVRLLQPSLWRRLCKTSFIDLKAGLLSGLILARFSCHWNSAV